MSLNSSRKYRVSPFPLPSIPRYFFRFIRGLLFAAVDTTSSAISRILHLLSQHPPIQEKVRREVTDTRSKHGDLPYDELVSLPYLDAICRETLRLYPPVSYVSRK